MQQEAIESTAANFNYLNNMACNTVVHLQILTPTKAIRLKTRLIGIDPNMSVILAIRHEDDWYTARNYMREGQGAIIRLISPNSTEASIIAFRTTIQKIMSIAGNWLVMDYPKELQKVSLRKSSRIPINIACTIFEKNSQAILSSGFLNDISIDGCAFIGKSLPGCKIGSEYDLQVKLDEEESEEESVLLTPIMVKNSLEKEHHTEQQQYGLTFQESSQETQDFIQKIIFRHLSLPPSAKTDATPK
jgi:c-di-GMP-binding flagellar brake protein YcgR